MPVAQPSAIIVCRFCWAKKKTRKAGYKGFKDFQNSICSASSQVSANTMRHSSQAPYNPESHFPHLSISTDSGMRNSQILNHSVSCVWVLMPVWPLIPSALNQSAYCRLALSSLVTQGQLSVSSTLHHLCGSFARRSGVISGWTWQYCHLAAKRQPGHIWSRARGWGLGVCTFLLDNCWREMVWKRTN